MNVGVRASFAILPGENLLEYELLRRDVTDEYSPLGPVEEDAVLAVAKCLWRKRRFQRVLASNLIIAELEPQHPAFFKDQLSAFLDAINSATDFREVSSLLSRQTPGVIDHLNEKCPIDDDDLGAWVQALR